MNDNTAAMTMLSKLSIREYQCFPSEHKCGPIEPSVDPSELLAGAKTIHQMSLIRTRTLALLLLHFAHQCSLPTTWSSTVKFFRHDCWQMFHRTELPCFICSSGVDHHQPRISPRCSLCHATYGAASPQR